MRVNEEKRIRAIENLERRIQWSVEHPEDRDLAYLSKRFKLELQLLEAVAHGDLRRVTGPEGLAFSTALASCFQGCPGAENAVVPDLVEVVERLIESEGWVSRDGMGNIIE